MAQLLGTLLLGVGDWVEFWAPGFSLPHLGCREQDESKTAGRRSLPVLKVDLEKVYKKARVNEEFKE